ANVLQEDRRDFLLPDVQDDARHVLGGGLGLGRDALGRDEADAGGSAKIAEGVVGGDNLASLGRNGGDHRLYLLLKLVELSQIGLRVGVVEALAGGVGWGERV